MPGVPAPTRPGNLSPSNPSLIINYYLLYHFMNDYFDVFSIFGFILNQLKLNQTFFILNNFEFIVAPKRRWSSIVAALTRTIQFQMACIRVVLAMHLNVNVCATCRVFWPKWSAKTFWHFATVIFLASMFFRDWVIHFWALSILSIKPFILFINHNIQITIQNNRLLKILCIKKAYLIV